MRAYAFILPYGCFGARSRSYLLWYYLRASTATGLFWSVCRHIGGTVDVLFVYCLSHKAFRNIHFLTPCTIFSAHFPLLCYQWAVYRLAVLLHEDVAIAVDAYLVAVYRLHEPPLSASEGGIYT